MLTIEIVGRPASPELLQAIERAIAILNNTLSKIYGQNYGQTKITYAPGPGYFDQSRRSDAVCSLIIRETNTPWADRTDDMERIGKIAEVLHGQTQMKIAAEVITPLLPVV